MTTVAAKPAAPAADDQLGAQWKRRQPDIPPPARADPRRRIVVLVPEVEPASLAGHPVRPPQPGAGPGHQEGHGQRDNLSAVPPARQLGAGS